MKKKQKRTKITQHKVAVVKTKTQKKLNLNLNINQQKSVRTVHRSVPITCVVYYCGRA